MKPTVVELIDRATIWPTGCWLIANPGTSAYPKLRGQTTHRLSHEFFNGPIPTGIVVRHTCHIPNCINPDHLVLGTQAENVADTVAANRHGWRTKER